MLIRRPKRHLKYKMHSRKGAAHKGALDRFAIWHSGNVWSPSLFGLEYLQLKFSKHDPKMLGSERAMVTMHPKMVTNTVIFLRSACLYWSMQIAPESH